MVSRDEYLDQIAADAHVRSRIEAAEALLGDAFPGVALGEVFVGNGNPAPDGPPFGGLWFFSETRRINVANFLTQPQFSVSGAKWLTSCSFRFSGWEPGRPTDASVMEVGFTQGTLVSAALLARGMNCTRLYDVVKRFLLPQVVGDQHG